MERNQIRIGVHCTVDRSRIVEAGGSHVCLKCNRRMIDASTASVEEISEAIARGGKHTCVGKDRCVLNNAVLFRDHADRKFSLACGAGALYDEIMGPVDGRPRTIRAGDSERLTPKDSGCEGAGRWGWRRDTRVNRTSNEKGAWRWPDTNCFLRR